jgi:chromosome partitioning protein
MGTVLAVVNQKGGVGKSTTAVNLGACLAELGQRVLIVDIDPQGNASSGLGIDKKKLEASVYQVLLEEKPLQDVILQTAIPRLDIAPATIALAGAEVELVSGLSREMRLKGALAKLQSAYDTILIDCPPSLGLLTLNALAAASGALVPIQCEYYALEGLGQLIKTLDLVRKHLNPSLTVAGVVLTMYDARTNLSQQVISEVRNFFREKVYQTVIPRNVKLSEAPSFGQPIILYDERSRGAEAYRNLAREFCGLPFEKGEVANE